MPTNEESDIKQLFSKMFVNDEKKRGYVADII